MSAPNCDNLLFPPHNQGDLFVFFLLSLINELIKDWACAIEYH